MTRSARNDGFLEGLLAFARRHDMLPREGMILCAVSGGADSMCLLEALRELGFSVSAAHFNHNLRGEESDADEKFVKDWCMNREIPFYRSDGDVRCFASQNGMSIEEAARAMRYVFLGETADKLGAVRIATAHNADDNAETILLNLTRGTGLLGLCGIPPVRRKIIRPLLGQSRHKIEVYLNSRSIPHVEDLSNWETVYTRNKLRHIVMPLLKEINPAFLDAVSRMSELLRYDEDFLSGQTDDFISSCSIEETRSAAEIKKLMELHPALRGRAMRSLISSVGASADAKQTEDILELIFKESPSAGIDLKNGVRVHREYGLIVAQKAAESGFLPKTLEIGKETRIDELNMNILSERVSETAKTDKTFNNLYFKKSAIRGSISVRPRKNGDRIRISTRGVSKTLKKLFIEEHIPAAKRENIPVFTDDYGILGVLGLGVDERAVPEPFDEAIKITVRYDTV